MPRLAIAVLVLAPIMTSAQGSVASRPIAERALHTMRVPGYADFLALDGDHAWVTNQGRVDRLAAGQNRPVASVPMAEPCGGMAVDFGALWVVNNKAGTLVRVDVASNRVLAEIPTGVADPSGEVSVATGAGSVWLLSDSAGVLSRVDPASNMIQHDPT